MNMGKRGLPIICYLTYSIDLIFICLVFSNHQPNISKMTFSKFTPQFFYTLILSILLWSCSKEGSEDPNDNQLPADEPGTVSANIDVDFFRSHGFFSVSSDLHIDTDYDQYDLQIDGEGEDDGIERRITISIFGTDFTSVKAGDVFVGGADVGSGGMRFDGDFYRRGRGEGLGDIDDITDSEQTSASICTITAIDHQNRLISGTFKFKSIDIFGSGLTFDITDGMFTEIPY